MPNCELCGKDTPLITAIIEGTEMNACANCAKFGRILKKPVSRAQPQRATAEEPKETLVADFPQRIRSAREKTGMTQKEFAQKLNEKESIIQKLENGTFTPQIAMARKLEKLLKTSLVQTEQEEAVTNEKKKTATLTIGDLIKIKKQ